jgi:uncharacterized membrane protein
MPEETPTTPGAEEVQCDPKDVEENKGITVLSYIGILCLIPLLAKKDSKFAQYHAKQGLVLFIAELITWVLVVIPVLGWIIYVVGIITWLVLSITGIVNVVGGKCKELPVVGKFAAKFKV